MRFIDLTGQVFGELTVLGRAPKGKHALTRWHCKCTCGKETIVDRPNLVSKRAQSCGCKQGQTHGGSYTPEYTVWRNMRFRCTNPNHPSYKDYGGRGIVVCEEWLKSFSAFIRDMGSRPSDDHELNRINNNGNYEPGNCRWTTRLINVRNSRVCLPS
jgi:hypothetical protein